jgi:hypothetical protein
MAQQRRIEYIGAQYHVFSRGNGRLDIFLADKDRHLFWSWPKSFLSGLAYRIH